MKVSEVRFVTIGQGRAVHAANVFTYPKGEEVLGAKCDQTGFANFSSGRKVRPVVAEKVTCKSCLRITKEA